ncbi:hypothetical protein ANN_08637 [Periplaneta americana]|uniref:Uncharacterized protein n=1 Tax=Periplaneta americana TaxID=6978 RepID=A0ABQ8T354_PERAM|nr:hypothetical protein ANN_08637 [Periplaneta americana]
MAGLCEGGNEPLGSLKAICNNRKQDDANILSPVIPRICALSCCLSSRGAKPQYHLEPPGEAIVIPGTSHRSRPLAETQDKEFPYCRIHHVPDIDTRLYLARSLFDSRITDIPSDLA